MSDLVERLRTPQPEYEYGQLCMIAAARITALEAEVTNLTKARAIDAGLMDGMKLVIKQLEAERDGARAAMAKEAESLCVKGILDCLAVMNESPHANLARIAARHSAFLEMQSAILTLATVPAGYVCVKVEPDDDQMEAGMKQLKAYHKNYGDDLRSAYRAMIDAKP